MSVGTRAGKLIKRERVKQGLSANELSRRTGVTARAITYWENGDRTDIQIDRLDRVLRELGITFTLGKD